MGFGIDAFAMQGIKLDSGDGRSGAGGTVDIMPYNSKGQPEDTYSKVGGAAKLRLLDTVVKVGDVFPSTPVVAYGDSRLLPESFRGATFGVLQGSCRVSRVFKLLFSLPAAPSLG